MYAGRLRTHGTFRCGAARCFTHRSASRERVHAAERGGYGGGVCEFARQDSKSAGALGVRIRSRRRRGFLVEEWCGSNAQERQQR